MSLLPLSLCASGTGCRTRVVTVAELEEWLRRPLDEEADHIVRRFGRSRNRDTRRIMLEYSAGGELLEGELLEGEHHPGAVERLGALPFVA